MKQNNHISNNDDDNDDNDDGKINDYHNKTHESNNHNSNDELNQFFEKTITANGVLPSSSSSSSSSSSMISATGDGRIHVFSQLSLSRPLLRAIEHTGYVAPTPIQIQTIPYALAGKDICGR